MWPKLRYVEYRPTYETLHRWIQIVGKIRTTQSPWVNHGWQSTLYVTPRGLTTSSIPAGPVGPDGNRIFSIDFDFIDHLLVLSVSDGSQARLPLKSESVAEFYTGLMKLLSRFGIQPVFWPRPNELSDDIRFSEDRAHHTYVPAEAHRIWSAFVQVDRVLKAFRSRFLGKCSPVHLFWGSFDLAVTRFSGRRAPEHPGGFPHLPDQVAREAYSHEVSSCGFWPGNEAFPEAALYSYAYPQPSGFEKSAVRPGSAFYHEGLREFILPYREVIRSRDPDQSVLEFCQTTYEAAAELASWDRDLLESSPGLTALQERQRSQKRVA